MFRKRRQPAPFFRMPGAPFNPATGENALLGQYPSKGTTLALFQVIEEDTHDNYVVCRGYEADSDPEFRYLHDPYTVPTTTPINVAKPYSLRGTYPYALGQIIVAARIKGRLGYNPGASGSIGQPADLDEEISLLTDDDDKSIAWLDIGTSAVESHFAGAGFGSINLAGVGTATQDVAFSTVHAQGGFSLSGSEVTWNQASRVFIAQVTCTILPEFAAPASDTLLLVGLRADTGSGYSANMQQTPRIWIQHQFAAGIPAPQHMLTISATALINIDNGTKYKMSAQRASGDAGLDILLDNCVFTLTPAY